MLRRGRKAAIAKAWSSVPPGTRVYAIGDVHGRHDLLLELLAAIEEDDARYVPAETHVVMLGDLIDRGPDTASVVDMLATGRPAFADFHFLMGNHEEMLLRLVDEPTAAGMAHFLRFGGRETFESYGVPQRMLDMPDGQPLQAITAHVPAAHLAFLRTFGDAIQFGDYLFVHAGIRPDVPMADQVPEDMRWIRNQFLESDADHGLIVVHGHTIAGAAQVRHNRIGIDTGAFATGILTAIGLQGTKRWLIATPPET